MSDALDLFADALELDPSERSEFLVTRCAGDEALRARVEGLLSAHTQAGDFLGDPTIELDEDRFEIGDVIGCYTLEKFLGEGGCGLVYEARQSEPVERLVALKLIKPEVQTPGMLARFDRERRVLARLQNPHVAALFEAGETEAGVAYFAMEQVAGEPITQHCETVDADGRERLRLFLQACSAVQHLHEKGVLHCDLKPANILVDKTGSPPSVKVIDFGIARALQGDSDGQALVGTPRYMAPELSASPDAIPDVRSDVFALGVVLRELLIGEDVELGWIIGCATHDDRRQRYASVHALADDLRRHQKHQPVVAGPGSLGYRLRKFVRRRRGAVVAASLLAVSLALGVIGLMIGLAKAEEQAREAKLQAEKAEFVAKYFGGIILRADPYGEADPGMRQIMGSLADKVGEGLDTYPDVEARIRQTIAHVQFGEGQYAEAYTNLQISLEKLGSDDIPDDPLEISDLERQMGNAALSRKRFAEAETHFRRAIELRPGSDLTDKVVIRSKINLAACTWRQGRMEEARQQLDALEAAVAPETAPDAMHRILREQFRVARAEKRYADAVAICERRLVNFRAENLPEDDPRILFTRAERAQCLGLGGLGDGALEELRAVERLEAKKFGENHPVALDRRIDIAHLLFHTGRREEAKSIAQKVLESAEKELGGDHKITLVARDAVTEFRSAD